MNTDLARRTSMRRCVAIACCVVALGWADAARATGDAAAGETVFKKSCAVCHTTEEGKYKGGPSLHGVVGRHAASDSGYPYSDALKKANKTWDDQTLDAYLANPSAAVPGTKMVFLGLKSADDRQNVIAFLESQK